MPLPERLPEELLSPRSEQVVHNERYVQDKRLGSGNFGTAYLVFDLNCSESEDKKVLKRIRVGDIEPGESTDAKKEADLLALLSHENVVQFHESFFDGTYFCIVTEYCDGGDMDMKLQEYKKKRKFVEERQVVEWLTQLLRALRYLHLKHILHRDLKAKNIFLKANQIKLGDFGISKILMGTTDMASTFVGTPYYMSPEVIKHDKYNDKSDIWSLGCILYEICVLKHAFDGISLMNVMYKICTGDIPKLPDTYSPGLNDILGKMLAREQSDRSSSKELLQHTIFGPVSEKDRSDLAGLTPKERLRRKKQREADEKFRNLLEHAEKTRRENATRHRESASRNFHQTSIDYSPPHDQPTASYHFEQRGNYKYQDRKFDIGDGKPGSQKYSRSTSDSSAPSLSPNDVVFVNASKTVVVPAGKPSSDINKTLALALSLSEDGTIPDDDDLADTYYSLNDDFEDLGLSDLDDSEFEDENVLNDSEYKEMLDHLQQIAGNGEESHTTRKDTEKPAPSSAMTNHILTSQMENMRKRCIEGVGKKVFEKAYSYLRSVWSNNLMLTAPDAPSVMQKVNDIVNDDKICFLLEQLVYLENEAMPNT